MGTLPMTDRCDRRFECRQIVSPCLRNHAESVDRSLGSHKKFNASLKYYTNVLRGFSAGKNNERKDHFTCAIIQLYWGSATLCELDPVRNSYTLRSFAETPRRPTTAYHTQFESSNT